MTALRPLAAPWPWSQRAAFRFFFIYWMLMTEPWTWAAFIPGLGWTATWWNRAVDIAVRWSNGAIFHVRPTLVPLNGSGDTSWGWARLWLFLVVAALGACGWSALHRRQVAYPRLGYWLRTTLRYWIAAAALSYGLIKIFALQMGFPSLSQLATPLGDLLPMRFSWLFIGYSTPYQVFSGVMETVAGLLLLPRRTVTLGLFAATGAFLNVVMINLAYDVPVKLFASHLLLACVFLLAMDARRLVGMLVLNTGGARTSLYDPPPFAKPWRLATRTAKVVLAGSLVILPLIESVQGWRSSRRHLTAVPLAQGIYSVRSFVINGDTLGPESTDRRRWNDVIIDNVGGGSVGTADTLFWTRYGRGYFRYRPDTATNTLAVWRSSFAFDSTWLFSARYALRDSAHATLWAAYRGDSIRVELERTPRHFQLAERQFHWISEYNR